MADKVTTFFGDISPRTGAYAAVGMLNRGQYLTVTERFGQAKPIPKKSSRTIKFRRYLSLLRATTPLAEGVPPTGQKLTYEDYVATLEQYGDFVEITDVIEDTHEDPVLQEMVGLCGEQIAETIEVVRINVLKGGTNVYYAGGASSRATTNSVLTRGDLRKVVRSFARYKGREISQIVKASALVATEPVAPAYFAMGHTDLDSDIRGLSGFTPVEKYSSSEKALPGEIGKCERVRFILTPLFEPWLVAATSVSSTAYLSNGAIQSAAAVPDVYPLIIVSKDAYGIVPLQGENAVTPAVMNPNKVSKSDKLGQVGFVSWKTYQTAVILNQNWIARVECLATASPS